MTDRPNRPMQRVAARPANPYAWGQKAPVAASPPRAERTLPPAPPAAKAMPAASKAEKPPPVATTTVRDTPAGKVYTVTWTDSVRFRFWDRYQLLFLSIWASVIALIAAWYFGSVMYFARGQGNPWPFLAFVTVTATVAFWGWTFWHERWRSTPRSLTILPDGTIELHNPPPGDPHVGTDGHPFVIRNGLKRIGSIEYSKTADWVPLQKERVFSVEHWYDVHLFLNDEWRVTIARSLGARDTPHQVAGHLNKLKAELSRPKPLTPARQTQAID